MLQVCGASWIHSQQHEERKGSSHWRHVPPRKPSSGAACRCQGRSAHGTWTHVVRLFLRAHLKRTQPVWKTMWVDNCAEACLLLHQVYAGLFPAHPGEFDALKSSLEKLLLNDASVQVNKDSRSVNHFAFSFGQPLTLSW